ncbi:Down syndrome cell adhesion molecule-like protein, partial [Stegodyphus mimosarum]
MSSRSIYYALKCSYWIFITCCCWIPLISANDAPKIQPFQFPTQIKRGDIASITCAIMRGHGPFSFNWLKDGSPIKMSSTVSVSSSNKLSNLVIEPVEENYSGNYTCVVHSKYGEDDFTAHLKVRAPPTWMKEP